MIYHRKSGHEIKNITKKQMIKEIAELTDYYPEDVETVYNALEKIVVDHLMETERYVDVEVGLFTGMKLLSSYVPEYKKTVPVYGEITVKEHLEFGCRFTKWWRQHRSEEFREIQKTLDIYNEKKEKEE